MNVFLPLRILVETPFQQSIVASFAPEAMRGRYMAVSRLSWNISFTVGRYLAGLLLDSANPGLLWVFARIMGMLATLGFIVLNKVHYSPAPASEPAVAD